MSTAWVADGLAGLDEEIYRASGDRAVETDESKRNVERLRDKYGREEIRA